MNKNRHKLVGKYFHTFHSCGRLNWQGRILSEDGEGHFLAITYSWLTGEPYSQDVFTLHEMASWRFYRSRAKMIEAYDCLIAAGLAA